MLDSVRIILLICLYLFVFFRIMRRNKRSSFLNKRISYSDFLRKRKQHKSLANYYRFRAKWEKRKYLSENYLGRAALYDHNSDTALECFNKSLNGIIGKTSNGISNNMSIAYIQKGMFREALNILDRQSEKGNVVIAPYIIALLANGNVKRAIDFKNQYVKEEDTDSDALNTLINFKSSNSTTLDKVREILKSNNFWLYQPAVEHLIKKWEVEVFFASSTRHETLSAQAQLIVSKINKCTELFSNPELRYCKSLILSVVSKISNYDDCANLFGLIQNLNTDILKLPLEEELLAELKLFWSRVYYVFAHTSNIKTFNKQTQSELIKAQIPPNAEPIVKYSNNCEIYISSTLNIALQTFVVNEQGVIYTKLLTKLNALDIYDEIESVMDIMSCGESLHAVLEPLLFDLVCNRSFVTYLDITNVLNRIPSIYHSKLEFLQKCYANK